MSVIDLTPEANVSELRKTVDDIEDWQVEKFERHMAQVDDEDPEECRCGAGLHYHDASIEVTQKGRIEIASVWACDREEDCPEFDGTKGGVWETVRDFSPGYFADEFVAMMEYEQHKAETLAQALKRLDG